MCDPVTATLVAAAVVSTVQQQVGANQQEHLYHETVKNADRAALAEFAAIDQRQRQEEAKAAQAIRETSAQARAARGAAAIQAAESGTRGASVNALLAQFERNELEGAEIQRQNLDFTRGQLAAERAAAAARRQDRVSNLPAGGPFDSPLGLIGAAVNIGGAYAQGQAMKPQPATTI